MHSLNGLQTMSDKNDYGKLGAACLAASVSVTPHPTAGRVDINISSRTPRAQHFLRRHTNRYVHG